jgi:hypothetical protein
MAFERERESTLITLQQFIVSKYNTFEFKHPTVIAKTGKVTKSGRSVFATFTLNEGVAPNQKTAIIRGLLCKDADGKYRRPLVFPDDIDFDITVQPSADEKRELHGDEKDDFETVLRKKTKSVKGDA